MTGRMDREAAFAVLLDDLEGETVALRRLLAGVEGDAWLMPTPSPGWSVRDQVGHLTYFDAAAVMCVTDPEQFRQEAARLRERGPSFPDLIAADMRSFPAGGLLDAFKAARAELTSAYRASDPGGRVPWYGPDMSVMSSATARLMETWAHGVDIAEALGAPVEDSRRVRHVVDIGVRTFAFSFANRGEEPPGLLPRIDLTLCDGSMISFGDASSADRITGRALDFALVVTQRRNVTDTGLRVEGPVSAAWMGAAQAFAGRPTSVHRHRLGVADSADSADSAGSTTAVGRSGFGRVRSMLFCPATRPERVAKIPATGADLGVIDLEDAVAPAAKEEARRSCREAAESLARTDPAFRLVIRINKPGSAWFDGDLEALRGLALTGVVLPKVERPDDVSTLRRGLNDVGLSDLPVMAGIETARGVTQLERILAGGGVDAVYFGAEDLAADLGATRTDDGLEVLHARSHVALHARTAGIPCVDQVVVRLDDDGLYERDASMGRSLGYHGKMCLHPRQVPLANRMFSPAPDEIERARRMIAAYESEGATGGGVFRFEGEMVDEPILRRARAVLEWVDAEEGSSDG